MDPTKSQDAWKFPQNHLLSASSDFRAFCSHNYREKFKKHNQLKSKSCTNSLKSSKPQVIELLEYDYKGGKSENHK